MWSSVRMKFHSVTLQHNSEFIFFFFVVLAFIASDEEYVDEPPATTRSGRAVTRRAEIDFSFF